MTPMPEGPLLRLRADREEDERAARRITAAGPPPPAPELEIARLQEAVRSEWRRRYAWRRRERAVRRWRLAAAVAVVVAAAGLYWLRSVERAPFPAPALAAIERLSGGVAIESGDERAAASGAPLAAGAVVRTAAGERSGRVALRWADGRSLRLDAGSELELLAADRVALHRGALYLDSRGAPAGGGPAIETPLGRFRAVGTRFELRVADGPLPSVRLRVREGSVVWREDGRSATAEAGVELELGGDGSLVRDRVAPHGAAWEWVLAAAPVPAAEGWTVARFLDWYAREAGLELGYADPTSRELAASVVVHGAVERLAAPDALDAVLASSGFAARAEGGILVAAARL